MDGISAALYLQARPLHLGIRSPEQTRPQGRVAERSAGTCLVTVTSLLAAEPPRRRDTGVAEAP